MASIAGLAVFVATCLALLFFLGGVSIVTCGFDLFGGSEPECSRWTLPIAALGCYPILTAASVTVNRFAGARLSDVFLATTASHFPAMFLAWKNWTGDLDEDPIWLEQWAIALLGGTVVVLILLARVWSRSAVFGTVVAFAVTAVAAFLTAEGYSGAPVAIVWIALPILAAFTFASLNRKNPAPRLS